MIKTTILLAFLFSPQSKCNHVYTIHPYNGQIINQLTYTIPQPVKINIIETDTGIYRVIPGTESIFHTCDLCGQVFEEPGIPEKRIFMYKVKK